MNSYTIIRAISAIPDMTYAEKFAGAILSLHLDRAKGFIKVRQKVIAEECGLTVRVVQSAVKKMVAAGIFDSTRTPRALILRPKDSVKESVKKHMNRRAYQRRTDVHITSRSKQKMPWDYYLTYSTLVEEEAKRFGHV